MFVFLLNVGNDIGLSDAADGESLFFDFIINSLVNKPSARNKNEKQKVDNINKLKIMPEGKSVGVRAWLLVGLMLKSLD